MTAPPRLVVEVPWGPQAGRKVAVPPGETLRVGRSDRAELSIPTDAELSALCFELTWDGAACHFRDLGKSKLAVQVDGEAVTSAALAHGAWIRAGGTDFRVWVEGAPRPAPAEVTDEEPADDEAYAAREQGRVARANDRARRSRVATVLTELSRAEHLHAVLDATRSERVRELISASLDQARSLYEGAEGEAMADISPWLVRFAPGSPLIERLIVEGWGARWGVFLTSAQPFKELRRHLRRFLMVTDEDGESLYFRYYDPEVLRIFLPTCAARQAEELWGDIDAFLFEGEGSGLERHDRADALAAARRRTA